MWLMPLFWSGVTTPRDGSLKRVFQGLWRGDWAVVTAGYEYRK
jgi:hypothetical protein